MNYINTNGQANKAGQVNKALTPILGVAIWLVLLCISSAMAQTTTFTYQGKLTDAGNPANGNYDLQFKLFDAPAGGAQQGATLARTPIAASAGLFTVTLDFGANVFSGADRYLEVGVRPAGSAGAYTVLAPRQPLTSSPYAIQTLNAQQLGGLPASAYVSTASVGNAFVKNGTAQQTGNFNISGAGTLGGNLVVNGGVGIGISNPTTGQLYVLNSNPGFSAIYGESASGRGVWGKSVSSKGVFGESASLEGVQGVSRSGSGVAGVSTSGAGVYGESAAVNLLTSPGVFGRATGVGGTAVYALSTGSGGIGVYAESATGRGVWGKSASSRGVYGESVNNVGVWGFSNASTGVFGDSASAAGVGGFFQNSGGGIALKVQGTGSVGVLQITGGSDLAEKFEVEDEAKPGMVVVIDPDNAGRLSIARGAYNRRVAGVISGANNLSAGMVLPDLAGARTALALPVALTGRVWVYCDATRRAINPGDLLTTSATPGHAMKVTNYPRAQGAIIGKAMTGLKARKGLVLVLVNLQ